MFQYPAGADENLHQQIPGPATPADQPAWLEGLRTSRRVEHSYRAFDDAEYGRPATAWTRRSFVQTLVMVEDRYFYDPAARRYTVDRLLDDFQARYGGVDSVVLWMMYPNLGVDDRNQFDHVRDLPGGVAGLARAVADFHRRGVRVFLPVKPWDLGTRDEGLPMWTAWARMAAEVGIDGLAGDTFYGVPVAYRTAARDLGLDLVLEPENSFAWEESALGWNLMSWGYWKFPPTPAVSRHKWTEPRHMVHVCDRWLRDKTHLLQAAFFNGTGVEPWENVWGIWNGMTARDGEVLRRMMTLQRAMTDLLRSQDWEPHAATVHAGVYASRWPGSDATLWTLVNRNEYAVSGPQVRVADVPGTRYYDLWRGVELAPRIEGPTAVLEADMEPLGFGALLAARQPPPGLDELLATMARLAARPLATFSAAWQPLTQQMTPVAATARQPNPPPGMVAIPAARFAFQCSGVMVEGLERAGVGVQFPWEDAPRRRHAHTLDVPAFHMDRYPVTNAQFAAFLAGSGYVPADAHNFLRHWAGDGPAWRPRPGDEDRPVTWVSLEDARAYARWAGKRLPHDWEWQYAAGGLDGRLYPWGSAWDPVRVPTPCRARTLPAPDPVGRHAAGASPFGVEDLVGHVWQWTDEFADDHTRAALVRGGSFYQPQGSHWYFPQAYRLDQHGKLLLMAPSRDRSGAIGFRCVVDAG